MNAPSKDELEPLELARKQARNKVAASVFTDRLIVQGHNE